ncbi:MAG: aspartyl protease family protein [Gammaproteobacteria bacterium]
MRKLVFLAFFLLPGLALAASPTAAQILAQSKAASGGDAWNRIHSMQTTATIEAGGLSGTANELDDLTTGRSVSHFALGPLKGAQGFNGKLGWSKSPGGSVAPDDSPAAKKRDATAAYQTAQAWWFPKRWPGKIESLGTRKDNQTTFQVLRITPRGGNPFELWINADTHLIARTVDSSGVLPQTTYLSDYRTVHGVKMAFHARQSNGKKQYDTVIQLKKVTVNVPVDAQDFARPQQKLNDFSIAGGKQKTTIPFKLINNHIYIKVGVNDHPLQLMLDTGGANVLTPQAAKRADIKSKGALEGGGVGNKSVNTGIGQVKQLTLDGKATLSNQPFSVMAMPGYSNVEGTEFDGLTGPPVFRRFVVRIDYAAQTLTLIQPKAFKPTDAGTAVPFTFIGGRIPEIKGSIDGLPGEFEIDTGSRAALSVFAPFAKKHDLASRYGATPPTVDGWGVGGSAKSRIARGGTLMIGSVAVHNPIVEISTATKGAFADKSIAGNIGGAILKRFTVTFDYAKQIMYLKPNKNYGMPMNYDRAGMWFNGKDGNFEVKSVLSGGPADKAGLKVGDVITAVNGKPASKLDLSTFREELRNGRPGSQIKLAIGEGAHAHTTTLVLRRLVPKTGGLQAQK